MYTIIVDKESIESLLEKYYFEFCRDKTQNSQKYAMKISCNNYKGNKYEYEFTLNVNLVSFMDFINNGMCFKHSDKELSPLLYVYVDFVNTEEINKYNIRQISFHDQIYCETSETQNYLYCSSELIFPNTKYNIEAIFNYCRNVTFIVINRFDIEPIDNEVTENLNNAIWLICQSINDNTLSVLSKIRKSITKIESYKHYPELNEIVFPNLQHIDVPDKISDSTSFSTFLNNNTSISSWKIDKFTEDTKFLFNLLLQNTRVEELYVGTLSEKQLNILLSQQKSIKKLTITHIKGKFPDVYHGFYGPVPYCKLYCKIGDNYQYLRIRTHIHSYDDMAKSIADSQLREIYLQICVERMNIYQTLQLYPDNLPIAVMILESRYIKNNLTTESISKDPSLQQIINTLKKNNMTFLLNEAML